MRKLRLLAWLAVTAILLAACAAAPAGTGTERVWRQGGIGVPVDPVYGTPAPGTPQPF
jgi:hypothetical protein